MLVADGRAAFRFSNFAVFPLSRQECSSLYVAEQALALLLRHLKLNYVMMFEVKKSFKSGENLDFCAGCGEYKYRPWCVSS